MAIAPLPENTFRTRNLLKHWNVPLRKVLAIWDKKSTKSWYPILLKNLFRTRSSLKQRRVSLRNDSLLISKSFSQSRDSFSSWKKISDPEVFWNKEGILYEMFRHCETKKSTRSWYPIVLEKLLRTRKFLKRRRVADEMFWYFETKKKMSKKSRYPILLKKTFENQKFWYEEGFLYEKFRHSETKSFR